MHHLGDRCLYAPNFKCNGKCDALILVTTLSWHVGKDLFVNGIQQLVDIRCDIVDLILARCEIFVIFAT